MKGYKMSMLWDDLRIAGEYLEAHPVLFGMVALFVVICGMGRIESVLDDIKTELKKAKGATP